MGKVKRQQRIRGSRKFELSGSPSSFAPNLGELGDTAGAHVFGHHDLAHDDQPEGYATTPDNQHRYSMFVFGLDRLMYGNERRVGHDLPKGSARGEDLAFANEWLSEIGPSLTPNSREEVNVFGDFRMHSERYIAQGVRFGKIPGFPGWTNGSGALPEDCYGQGDLVGGGIGTYTGEYCKQAIEALAGDAGRKAKAKGAILALWSSSKDGFSMYDQVARAPGMVEEVPGPLKPCSPNALHASLSSHRVDFAGARHWIVAMHPPVVYANGWSSEVASLKREIICELPCPHGENMPRERLI